MKKKSASAVEFELLEIFAKEWNWVLPEGLGQIIGENLAIEIYSADGLQVYRNLNFLKSSSYSLLALENHPIQALYECNSDVKAAVLSEFENILTPNSAPVVSSQTPPHFLKERLEDDRGVVEVQIQNLAAICNQQGQRVAVLVTSKRSCHRVRAL